MQHMLALGNVPFRGGLVEFPATVRTLDIIAGVAGRGWRQILQTPTCRQVRLHYLSRANRLDKLLMFAPPVRLEVRLLRLKRHKNTYVSASSVFPKDEKFAENLSRDATSTTTIYFTWIFLVVSFFLSLFRRFACNVESCGVSDK